MNKISEVNNGVHMISGYTVPNVGGYPHGFYVPTISEPELQRFHEVRNWCIDQFTPDDLERWFQHRNVFWFKSSADAAAFKMRWL